MKKIILLALLTVIVGLGASQMALADNSILSVSPASLNSTLSVPFNVSVQLNPASNKVCVVRGILNFNNLSCQAITVASGLYAVITPTCANPSFLIGIPTCATTIRNIFSVSIKGSKVGQANISITGVKVIGAGKDVAFNLQGGTYNITATQITTPETSTPETTIQETEQQPEQTTAETNTDSTSLAQASFVTMLGDIITLGTNNWWFGLLTIIVLIAVIFYGYRVYKKRKKA